MFREQICLGNADVWDYEDVVLRNDTDGEGLR